MRVLNRPLAFILAAALIAACVIVISEVIGFAVHRSPLLVHWTTWYHWARRTRWDAEVVRVWSAILIVIGALILALELKPPRATRLPLRSGDDATDAAVTRRGVAGLLRSAATGVEGISSAAVKVRRRRARVTATSAARGRPAATALTERVTQAARSRLDSLDMRNPLRLTVQCRPPEPLMHADRTNRVALTLFGLLVLAVGGAGIAASTGGFGTTFSRRTLLANQAGSYIGQHGGWLWLAVAGACLLLALVCLRWILALLASTDRVGEIIIPGGKDQGTTVMHPAAVTDALASEIGAYHGVGAVKGRVIGDGNAPEIVLTVSPAASADLPALHRRIETEALAHARQALSKPSLPVRLDLV